MRLVRVCVLLLLTPLFWGGGYGCSSGPARVADGPPPSYDESAEAYNERAGRLERLWARASVQVSMVDEDGRRRREQGEGHLQIVQPRNLALTVGKHIDRTYFYLGSSEEWFWWFDMADTSERVALVGTHAGASRARAEEFGVPVHPLDLMLVLGITPIPEGGASRATTRWSDDETALIIEHPTRWGSARLELDPTRWEPSRIVLFDEDGREVVTSDLSRYRDVRVRGDLPPWPRVPGMADIRLHEIDADVKISLFAPESSQDRPRGVAFELEQLLEAYGIHRLASLDDEPASGEIDAPSPRTAD